MSDIRTGTVTSADGTVIGFDQSGAGPAVILVQGALMNRSDPVMTGIAAKALVLVAISRLHTGASSGAALRDRAQRRRIFLGITGGAASSVGRRTAGRT